MSWVKVEDRLPKSGTDVHVVTQFGVKGVAKYWKQTGKWLTEMNVMPDDRVIEWWDEETDSNT